MIPTRKGGRQTPTYYSSSPSPLFAPPVELRTESTEVTNVLMTPEAQEQERQRRQAVDKLRRWRKGVRPRSQCLLVERHQDHLR